MSQHGEQTGQRTTGFRQSGSPGAVRGDGRAAPAVGTSCGRNVANAIDNGDLTASLTLLKGLGVLSGNPLPPIGSTDPEVLEAEAEAEEAARGSHISDMKLNAMFSI